MNVKQIVEFISGAKESNNNDDWFKGTDALKFLHQSRAGDVPVYLSGKGFYVYSVLVHKELLTDDYVQDILGWNFGPSTGWGYGDSYEDDINNPHPILFSPLHNTGSKILQNAEPIFFLREFEGYKPFSSYPELNQRFAHVLGIHWIPSREAYCKINNEGDIDEVATAGRKDKNLVCTIKRDALDFYMFFTKTVLIRVFDVTRGDDWLRFHKLNKKEKYISEEKNEIYARNILAFGKREKAECGSLRGFQIIRNQKTYDKVMSINTGKDEREFATFVAYDWKHGKVCELSCNPAQLGNYFVESDFPLEISPVFFKPEVLAKYKQDPDKYTVQQRSISCRCSWYLKTYDINEAGQVHTYLAYLGHLPFKEQLYWKSFNEPPKASISKRAFTTDIKGTWDTSYDPLEELKVLLNKFPSVQHNGKSIAIWSFPKGEGDHALDKLHYVITESKKEWQDQILELAKLIVDGFEKRVIRKIAATSDCDDPQLGSLKLLAACLHAHSVDDDVIIEIMKPLFSLWEIRSALSAHGGGTIPEKDLKADYRRTVTDIHNSMNVLARLMRKGFLNIPFSGKVTERLL